MPSAPEQVGCVIVVARDLTDTPSINELLESVPAVVMVRDVDDAVRWLNATGASTSVRNVAQRSGMEMEREAGKGLATGADLVVGPLEIRADEHRVLWEGRPVELSEQERGILSCLARRAGCARSYRDLIDEVWGAGHGVDTTVVHSAIRRLRRKLEKAGAEIVIEAIRGYGLRLLTGR
jgi:DNA-binding response OmpR family regulator